MNSVDNKLSRIIVRMILRIVRYTLTQPITSFNQAKMAIYQYHFSRIRKNKSNADISIPPFMIYSITKSCNLNCKGCYAKVNQTLMGEELNMDEVKSIFRQCQQLGIGIIMLAGGEPFTKMDVINLCKSFPKLLFPIFTNGLLLSSDIIRNLSHNVIPVLSIEGNQQQTDSRRGDDVYQSIKSRFKQLHMSKRFWGVSITVTSQNLKEVLSDDFILKLIRHGCKLFFFVEYVPVIENTDHLILSAEDKESLVMRTDIFSEKYSSLFIAFPGDEEKWGGCLAAGRGFVHIQADGSMEPCPFAPYSDVSLKDVTLEKALASSFLAKIKKNTTFCMKQKVVVHYGKIES